MTALPSDQNNLTAPAAPQGDLLTLIPGGREATRVAEQPAATTLGSINWLETVSYSAALGLIALTASGFFDAMLPWR